MEEGGACAVAKCVLSGADLTCASIAEHAACSFQWPRALERLGRWPWRQPARGRERVHEARPSASRRRARPAADEAGQAAALPALFSRAWFLTQGVKVTTRRWQVLRAVSGCAMRRLAACLRSATAAPDLAAAAAGSCGRWPRSPDIYSHCTGARHGASRPSRARAPHTLCLTRSLAPLPPRCPPPGIPPFVRFLGTHTNDGAELAVR